MRYHIDTIPVWDAVKLDGECPLCFLRRQTEHLLIDRYLGASVMESDTRIMVNEKGFCPGHQAMLYAKQNRLGHALMMHSHMQHVQKQFVHHLEQATAAAREDAGQPALKRWTRKGGDGLQEAAQAIHALADACVLCDSLADTMNRYVYTMLHLWKTDPAFVKAIQQSKGFCLKDTALLMDMAKDHLKAAHRVTLLETLSELAQSSFTRTADDLEWFTLKYDYRNADKPWNNSKDALERAVQKLRSCYIGTDPARDS